MPATPSSPPVLKTLHHVPPTKPEHSPTKHSHPPTQDPSPTTTASQEEALTAEQAIETPPTEQHDHPPPPPGALRRFFRFLTTLFHRQPHPRHAITPRPPSPCAQQQPQPHPQHANPPRPPSPCAQQQPQSSPPSPPHCPPLESHSPVWHFKEYLKSFYSHPKDPVATWPPSPSKIFVNLAVINREEISTEELHQFMLATLNKGVDTIL